MSPHLPIAPKIADAAVAAAEAGAAIVHLHAREPVDGRPTQDPKYFREFAPEIARRSDVVINFTTGGASTMTLEERLQPALQLKPEVASLNMGSMNFGLYPMLARYKDFKFDWDGRISKVGRSCVQEHVSRYRTHLTSCAGNKRFGLVLRHRASVHRNLTAARQAAALYSERVRHPGRVGPHLTMSHETHRLLATVSLERARRPQSVANCCNVGRDGRQCSRRAGRQSVARTWQARRIKCGAGACARQIVEALGLEVATPDDARKMLALKGKAAVGF
jgi:uncharacterized protein (DUF849 family)